MCYVVGGKESREDVADEASDSMFSEDIKGIVNANDELQLGCVVGSSTGADAVDYGRPGRYVPRARA